MTTATLRGAALSLLALAGPAALAQTTQPAPLGDDFILFVDGTNVRVPGVEGTIVADPAAPTSGNKVIRFDNGTYAHRGFFWTRNQGVDATAFAGATYGESDTLYLRLRSAPVNAEAGMVNLWLTDKTNDSAASREAAEADPTLADHQMRLQWAIPAELHDGEWHDLAIPLPPTTYAALESARADGLLMDGAENWRYTGAWTDGGYGVGEVNNIMPGTDDPLFREFEWNALYKIGPVWDNNGALGGAPIYLDNVYIGGPNTDLAVATQAPTAMSGVTFEADDTVNRVSWAEVAGAGGYNVYTSLRPITDVTSEDVKLLQRISVGEPNEIAHRYEKPHPTLGVPDVYYAVTTLSEFGVENTSIASSAGNVKNANLPNRPFIRQLTLDQAIILFDAVNGGTVTDAGFPAEHPVFVLDSNHRTVTEGPAPPPTDADNSATFKIGYTDEQEWFVYGEITDDVAAFAPPALGSGDTYLYDTVEFMIGHYDVRETDAYGDILLGSPHAGFMRGAEPDYQIRVGGRQDAAGTVSGSVTLVAYDFDGTDTSTREIEDATVAEKTATGWRFLTRLPMNMIQSPVTSDATLLVPGPTEIQFIPFTISLNDRDATADGTSRETQIAYSVKPGVNGLVYTTPTQWEVVAIAGANVVATDAEDVVTQDGFALAQSRPNPAVERGQDCVLARRSGPRHRRGVQRTRPARDDGRRWRVRRWPARGVALDQRPGRRRVRLPPLGGRLRRHASDDGRPLDFGWPGVEPRPPLLFGGAHWERPDF